jgi:hypothetical protein
VRLATGPDTVGTAAVVEFPAVPTSHHPAPDGTGGRTLGGSVQQSCSPQPASVPDEPIKV